MRHEEKECPFCGHPAIPIGTDGHYQGWCEVENLYGPYRKTPEEAVQAFCFPRYTLTGIKDPNPEVAPHHSQHKKPRSYGATGTGHRSQPPEPFFKGTGYWTDGKDCPDTNEFSGQPLPKSGFQGTGYSCDGDDDLPKGVM